ncbi:MAG: hypothetical protein AAGI91_15525 [Bacteroidota bacterium]
METFLFYLGLPGAPRADFLHQSGKHLAQAIPNAGTSPQTTVTHLDGSNGGWCLVEPPGVGLSLLDAHTDDQTAVLVFGDLVGVPGNQTVATIARAGTEAASDLDGSFGAVVLHRAGQPGDGPHRLSGAPVHRYK